MWSRGVFLNLVKEGHDFSICYATVYTSTGGHYHVLQTLDLSVFGVIYSIETFPVWQDS